MQRRTLLKSAVLPAAGMAAGKTVAAAEPPAGAEGARVLVQGIADLLLIYPDHLELLDYKTDRNKTADQLAADYRPQLLMYAAAVGRRLAKPVTKLTLYSFWLGREIDLPLGEVPETFSQKKP